MKACPRALNWERLEKYLDFLVRHELLKKSNEDEKAVFSITPKGRDVLGYFMRFESELYSNRKTPLSEVCVR